MKITKKSLTIASVGVVLICVIIFGSLYMSRKEGFQSKTNEQILLEKYSKELGTMNQSDLTNLAAQQRLRLDTYGLYPRGSSPDLSKYALKSEILPDTMTKCTVANAEDRDKYLHKSDIPDPGPKIDLNKYVLKSSIPPEKICPPQKEIDYSKYVLKSSLPPVQKCPPCICPKVKVSAGLCKKCPPPPKCPPPQPCPESRCPEPKPCPDAGRCPEPEPCPSQSEKVRYDVKYIKVPTIITKVVKVDEDGNVLSQTIKGQDNLPEGIKNKVNSVSLNSGLDQNGDSDTNARFNSSRRRNRIRNGNGNRNGMNNSNQTSGNSSQNNTTTSMPTSTTASTSTSTTTTLSPSNDVSDEGIFEESYDVKQFSNNELNDYSCSRPELNSEFKQHGIYGYPI